jgi:choline monooxygenase
MREIWMTRSFDEILGKDSIANLQKPIETARGLLAAYTSQEFFDLEQERLFPRTWIGVAFAEDVANPGDAILVTVTGLPLITVHDKKGVVRAFHNVCRHRATIIPEKPEKEFSNLSRPYHA